MRQVVHGRWAGRGLGGQPHDRDAHALARRLVQLQDLRELLVHTLQALLREHLPDRRLELGVVDVLLRENGTFFEWFPYVCPEPVLVK